MAEIHSTEPDARLSSAEQTVLFRLDEISEKWGIPIDHVWQLAIFGKIQLFVYWPGTVLIEVGEFLPKGQPGAEWNSLMVNALTALIPIGNRDVARIWRNGKTKIRYLPDDDAGHNIRVVAWDDGNARFSDEMEPITERDLFPDFTLRDLVIDQQEIEAFENSNKWITNKAQTTLIRDSEPQSPARTRKTRITIAVERARDYLMRKLNREPTADEVFHHLEESDSTDYVVDSKPDKLVWVDTRGKLMETSRKSIANLLSRIRNPA